MTLSFPQPMSCFPSLLPPHRTLLPAGPACPEHVSILSGFHPGEIEVRRRRKGGILLLRSPHYFLNFSRNVISNATGPSNPCLTLLFPFLLLWPNAFWCSLAQVWREDQGSCAEVNVLVPSLKAGLLAKWIFCGFPISMSPPSFSVRGLRGCFRNM